MRKKAIYILLTAILLLILEKAWVECSQRGFETAERALFLVELILKSVFLVLLTIILFHVARSKIRRETILVVLIGVLFPLVQRGGIECGQRGFAVTGSWLESVANILKVVFLIALVYLFISGIGRASMNVAVRLLLGILAIPVLFVCFMVTFISGWLILNSSRPVRPDVFIKDQSAVAQLTDLANEMIQRKHITWVGNGRYSFIFAIKYPDGDFQFDSTFVRKDHNFTEPIEAEDMSKVEHFDLPFIRQGLKPTDKKILDPNDYAFCKRASETIRRIGFDNVKLYPDRNVVQYQICLFIGWDNGVRYVYCFCPQDTLPEDFTYTTKVIANWYYIQKPRFSQ